MKVWILGFFVALLVVTIFFAGSCSKDNNPAAPAPVLYRLYVAAQDHVTWQYFGDSPGITDLTGSGQGLRTVDLPTTLTESHYCFRVRVTSQSDSAQFKINDEAWTWAHWNANGTAIQICGNR